MKTPIERDFEIRQNVSRKLGKSLSNISLAIAIRYSRVLARIRWWLSRGIRVYSLCEHHLLPFWCDISIGYVARDHVLGLSKFARVAQKFAHKLQVQERLVHEIADEIQKLVLTDDVAVYATGEHLCMLMRGIKSSGRMTTSVMRGVFLKDPLARSEFLKIISM